MVNAQKIHRRLNKRLFPLYIAAFLHGAVLWYAIEKLFMGTIGFNDAGIGAMVAAYGAAMLLLETPSGILADRWSRKGVLILASVALAISSLLGGLSTEPIMYIICAAFWGMFYAFYSGTYDSIVYDTVQEETGKSDDYSRYYGRIKIADSISLVLGGFAGGLVSEFYSMQSSYFATIPIALGACVALWMFKEPQLHKAESLGSIKEQLVTTFRAVLGRKVLIRLLLVVISVALVYEVIYEFSQLWLTATRVDTALFGPAFALVISSSGIAGLLAGKLSGKRSRVTPIAFALLLAGSVVLTFAHEFIVIVIAQAIVGGAAVLLSIFLLKDMHDLLPSAVRAGASSAVSTMTRACMIVLGLGFGVASAWVGIFATAWLLVGIVCIAALFELSRLRHKRQIDK